MKEKEQEGCLDSLFSEAIAIVLGIPLNQPMSFHLAQVIAELGKGIGRGLEIKAFQKSLMEITSSPGGDAGAGMHQHLHEANQAGIVDLDPCDFGMTRNDRESHPLEQREIDVDLKGSRLKGGEAVDDG
jgi:hypothetical protein